MKKLIFVIGFLLLFGNAYSQWFYQNNPDSISNVSSGSFINSNTGWYARSKGEISKTTDGGISWNTYKVDINDLNSIKFVNANTGYVCGNNGRLMKSTNGGLNWSWQNPNSSDTLVTIDFINELTGWCAGKDFIIFTTNGGSQWYRQNVDTNTVKPRFTVLKIYDSQSGLAGAFNKKNYTGDYAYIYRTSNGGVNWYFVDSVWRYRTYSICYINQNVVYLSTYMYLYKSINGGISWNVVSSLPNYSFYKNNIQFKNENNGWVLRNTCIYETINGGINWSNSILNGIDNFIDINLLPNGTIFASACKGAIYKTTNEGYCWGNYSINIESNLIGIKIFDENNIFLGGSETLCKSTNGGVNWQIKCRDSIYNLSEPVFLNYNTGFFLLNKNILKTTNCGENWYLVGETFPKPIHHMCCTDEYNFWVVGDSGMIMKSTNSGNSWVNKSIGDSLTLYRINVNNNNIFINTFGRLLKSTNAGNNWNWIDILLDTLYPFYNIYFINLQTGWLIPCDGIRFCKTFDGGNTWIKYYRQIENNLPTLRCFFVNENTGYAATSSCYYGLIKTTNSGINWSIVTSFPTNNYMTNNVS
ncbi:MAG: YCF48-related protein, partial [Ignavibacteriae bacterium]|nr:YCF48-related protein [Ignavibacteriota bacterium]